MRIDSPMARFRFFFHRMGASMGLCRFRYDWSFHLSLLLPLICVMVYVGLAHGCWGEPVRQSYESARYAFPGVTACMHIITSWGSPLLYVVYLALLIYGVRHGKRADVCLTLRYLVFSLLITLLATQMLKYGLGMPRPDAPWPPQPLSFSFSYNSFPSGHTTEITASALPLAFRFRHKPVFVIALALLVALVGYSRVWLGRHHPVDIVAGMLLGSLAARLITAAPRDHA